MNMTVMEFASKYGAVEAFLELLYEVRWADGAFCPHCGSIEGIYHFGNGKRRKCKECGRTFGLITSTIFDHSPIKLLPKWFMAIYLDANHSKGLSSVQLAKDISVTRKTAWHMLHRIRHAANNGGGELLSGTVEADETFIDGKERSKHTSKRLNAGRGTVGKQAVLVMKERGSSVVAQPVPGTKAADIYPPIVANVEIGSRPYSDEHGAYANLPYTTESVRHSAVEHVDGDVHTNGIESLWSMVKRCYVGTHRWWFHKHSVRHVDACAFRQNYGAEAQHGRMARIIRQELGVKMPYKHWVGVAA